MDAQEYNEDHPTLLSLGVQYSNHKLSRARRSALAAASESGNPVERRVLVEILDQTQSLTGSNKKAPRRGQLL